MNLEHSTATTLRVGILLGLALIVIGLITEWAGMGDGLIYAGLLLLIASPFLGVITTTVCLFVEKDVYWGVIGIILLLITSSGIILNLVT